MSKTFKLIAIVLSVAIIGVAGYFGYRESSRLKDIIKTKDREIAQLKETNLKEVMPPTEVVEESKETEKVVTTQKIGKLRFSTGFPSSFSPAFRICFSNYDDLSLQYCYWVKNTHDKKDYSNDLIWTSSGYEVSLPVGRYIVDFTVYTFDSLDSQGPLQNVSSVYALKECVYYADGEGKIDTLPYCGSVEQELKKYTSGIIFPDSILLNSREHGGEMMIFEVKEGQVTTLKKFSLAPYLDINR